MRLRLPAPRTLALLAALVPLLGLFGHVVMRSGPLAPVPVTVAAVELRPMAPALFGIGTVEARFRYPIGPVVAGRVLRVMVDVGERVRAGQLLGEMDPVDLDSRVAAQIYAASVMAIEVDTDVERHYLQELATKLGLDQQVVAYLHRSIGVT